MPKTTRQANVLYRKLTPGTNLPNNTTLSEAIKDAFDKTHPNGGTYASDWRHRIVEHDDSPARFINNSHFKHERAFRAQCAFGNLCAFNKGEMHATLEEDPRQPAATVPLQDLIAPGDHEFLEGIAYWLVIGNHCYIVQDAHVNAKAFEQYLEVFLMRAFNMQQLPTVVLQAEFDIELMEDAMKEAGSEGGFGDVVSIRVGGLAPDTMPEDFDECVQDGRGAPRMGVVLRGLRDDKPIRHCAHSVHFQCRNRFGHRGILRGACFVPRRCRRQGGH